MSGILLPKGVDLRDPEHLTPERLESAAEAQEKAALNAEIAGRLSPLPPYRDDAPVCDTAWWQNVDGIHTQYHGVIQAPVWSHGRCIGGACVRFLAGLNTCGRVVQDWAAAVQLGLATPAEAAAAIEAAKPSEAIDE